jgi:hypothetical protein
MLHSYAEPAARDTSAIRTPLAENSKQFASTDAAMSPAFDVHPNPYKRKHVLSIDGTDSAPDSALLLATAAFYRLNPRNGLARRRGIESGRNRAMGAVIVPLGLQHPLRANSL